MLGHTGALAQKVACDAVSSHLTVCVREQKQRGPCVKAEGASLHRLRPTTGLYTAKHHECLQRSSVWRRQEAPVHAYLLFLYLSYFRTCSFFSRTVTW